MLIAFGTFWAGEGLGLEWPGGDLAILGLLGFYCADRRGLITCLAPPGAPAPAGKAVASHEVHYAASSPSGTISSSATPGKWRRGDLALLLLYGARALCRGAAALAVALLLPLAIALLLAYSLWRVSGARR